MGKDIDRIRARSAIETVRESPVIALIAVAPALLVFGVVWWLVGPGWAVMLLIVAGALAAAGGKFRR